VSRGWPGHPSDGVKKVVGGAERPAIAANRRALLARVESQAASADATRIRPSRRRDSSKGDSVLSNRRFLLSGSA